MINSCVREDPKRRLTHLPWWQRAFVQRLFLLLATLVLAASLGLTMGFSPLAHAATLSQVTCAQNPIFENCSRSDPAASGCTDDAETMLSVPIRRDNINVGFLQLRHSNQCNSFWGRCISVSSGFANLYMLSPFREDINGTFRGRAQGAYTNMVFGALQPRLRCVIGFSANDAPEASIGQGGQ